MTGLSGDREHHLAHGDVGLQAGVADCHVGQWKHPVDHRLQPTRFEQRQRPRGERAHYHLEKRYIGREGNVIWTRLSVSLVRSEQGDPLHFVSQIQDVTAQHASEQRLLQAEQRSRITLDAVTDLVLSVDLDGRIEHFNATADVGRLLADSPLAIWINEETGRDGQQGTTAAD